MVAEKGMRFGGGDGLRTRECATSSQEGTPGTLDDVFCSAHRCFSRRNLFQFLRKGSLRDNAKGWVLVTDIEITQLEADALMAMEKHRLD